MQKSCNIIFPKFVYSYESLEKIYLAYYVQLNCKIRYSVMHSWRKLSRVFTNQSFAAFKVDDTVQILSSQIRTPIAIPNYPHLRFLVVRWRVYCVVGVIGQGESMAVLDHAQNCIIVTAGFPDPCTVGRDSATQIYLVCVVTIIWYYLPRTKPWWIKK